MSSVSDSQLFLSAVPSQLLEVLYRYAVNHQAHSGRTLLDHLVGTYSILLSWQCDQAVCVGGLFHSIYGTASFRHESASFEQRETLEREIGTASEEMAYLFSVSGSTRERLGAVATGLMRSRRDGSEIAVSSATARALLVIDCANLVEQGGAAGLTQLLGKLTCEQRGELLGSEVAGFIEEFMEGGRC